MNKLNNNKNQFIITFDKDVSNRLQIDGYTLLSEENDKCIFLNDGILKFSEDEDMVKTMDKIHYTNVLCF